jgi:glutamate dehydrogenase/leucine dehydrogenase
MMVRANLNDDDHERVVFFSEAATSVAGIKAIHSTALGPAFGGCRYKTYPSPREALTCATRRSPNNVADGMARDRLQRRPIPNVA